MSSVDAAIRNEVFLNPPATHRLQQAALPAPPAVSLGLLQSSPVYCVHAFRAYVCVLLKSLTALLIHYDVLLARTLYMFLLELVTSVATREK